MLLLARLVECGSVLYLENVDITQPSMQDLKAQCYINYIVHNGNVRLTAMDVGKVNTNEQHTVFVHLKKLVVCSVTITSHKTI